jgi:hypothetical protein
MACRVFSLVVTMVVLPFAAGAQLGDMPGSVPEWPSVQPPPVCQQLQALNDENQKKWRAIEMARERKASVREFCHLHRNFLSVEMKVVKVLEVIEERGGQTCGAPPHFLKRLKAHYRDASQTGTGFCVWPPGDYWRPGELPR